MGSRQRSDYYSARADRSNAEPPQEQHRGRQQQQQQQPLRPPRELQTRPQSSHGRPPPGREQSERRFPRGGAAGGRGGGAGSGHPRRPFDSLHKMASSPPDGEPSKFASRDLEHLREKMISGRRQRNEQCRYSQRTSHNQGGNNGKPKIQPLEIAISNQEERRQGGGGGGGGWNSSHRSDNRGSHAAQQTQHKSTSTSGQRLPPPRQSAIEDVLTRKPTHAVALKPQGLRERWVDPPSKEERLAAAAPDDLEAAAALDAADRRERAEENVMKSADQAIPRKTRKRRLQERNVPEPQQRRASEWLKMQPTRATATTEKGGTKDYPVSLCDGDKSDTDGEPSDSPRKRSATKLPSSSSSSSSTQRAILEGEEVSPPRSQRKRLAQPTASTFFASSQGNQPAPESSDEDGGSGSARGAGTQRIESTAASATAHVEEEEPPRTRNPSRNAAAAAAESKSDKAVLLVESIYEDSNAPLPLIRRAGLSSSATDAVHEIGGRLEEGIVSPVKRFFHSTVGVVSSVLGFTKQNSKPLCGSKGRNDGIECTVLQAESEASVVPALRSAARARTAESTADPMDESTRYAKRRRTRSQIQEKKSEVIDLAGDDDDEDDGGSPSVGSSITRQFEKISWIDMEVMKIAIDTSVHNSSCRVVVDGRNDKYELQYAQKSTRGLGTRASSRNKSTAVKTLSFRANNVRNLHFHCVGDTQESACNVESDLVDDPEQKISFLAFKLLFDGDDLRELKGASDSKLPLSVEVEFRNDSDLNYCIRHMAENDYLSVMLMKGELSSTNAKNFAKFSPALLKFYRAAAKSRQSALSSPHSKNQTDTFLVGRGVDDVLVVYPFGGDAAAIEMSAEGLKEAKGNEEPNVAVLRALDDSAEDEESTKYSGRGHYMTIRVGDYERLEPTEYLNDTLIDFWMQWFARHADRSKVHLFSSHFYTALKKKSPDIAKWTRNKGINVFEKKLIFIPINQTLHWSLCVVVNPGEIGNSYKGEDCSDDDLWPGIYFFDSLKAHQMSQVAGDVRRWLNSECKRHFDTDKAALTTGMNDLLASKFAYERDCASYPFDSKKMKAKSPKVPYQDNGWDCGVFVCRYAYAMYELARRTQLTFRNTSDSRFISESEEFDFDMVDIARIREEMKTLIQRLSKVYAPWKAEEVRKEKEEKAARKMNAKKSSENAVGAAPKACGASDTNASCDESEPPCNKLSLSNEAPVEPCDILVSEDTRTSTGSIRLSLEARVAETPSHKSSLPGPIHPGELTGVSSDLSRAGELLVPPGLLNSRNSSSTGERIHDESEDGTPKSDGRGQSPLRGGAGSSILRPSEETANLYNEHEEEEDADEVAPLSDIPPDVPARTPKSASSTRKMASPSSSATVMFGRTPKRSEGRLPSSSAKSPGDLKPGTSDNPFWFRLPSSSSSSTPAETHSNHTAQTLSNRTAQTQSNIEEDDKQSTPEQVDDEHSIALAAGDAKPSSEKAIEIVDIDDEASGDDLFPGPSVGSASVRLSSSELNSSCSKKPPSASVAVAVDGVARGVAALSTADDSMSTDSDGTGGSGGGVGGCDAVIDLTVESENVCGAMV